MEEIGDTDRMGGDVVCDHRHAGVSGRAGGGGKVDGKIGVINSQRLLNETNAGKRAKENLTAFSKNRQALMELEEKELRRMEEDFVKQSSS